MKNRIASAAVALVVLSACSAEQPQMAAVQEEVAVAAWQDAAKASAEAYQESLTDDQRQQQCAALITFGLADAEAMVSFAESLGGPALTEYGIDPASVPDGSTREAALIGAQAAIEACR
jgi:hypothetical protein